MLRDGGLVDAEMKERDGDGVSRALASVRSKRSNLERRRWRSLSVTSTTLFIVLFFARVFIVELG
jgi:hypothetical protein